MSETERRGGGGTCMFLASRCASRWALNSASMESSFWVLKVPKSCPRKSSQRACQCGVTAVSVSHEPKVQNLNHEGLLATCSF